MKVKFFVSYAAASIALESATALKLDDIDQQTLELAQDAIEESNQLNDGVSKSSI